MDTGLTLNNVRAEILWFAADAKTLADAEAKLEKAQRVARKTQLDYQKQAEKLRQIRDDESLSIAQRVKANEELGKTLQKQLDSELEIAEQALIVANLRIQAEGKNKSTLDAQAEALTNIADIQERITSQESEQLTNRNALYKEANEKAKEAANNAIKSQEELLDKYIAQQGTRKKSLQEQLDFEQKVADKSIEILDAQLRNKNISQEKYDAEYLKIKDGLAQSKANLIIDDASKELDQYIKTNEAKLSNDKFFNDEALKLEQERIDNISKKQKEFADLQLSEGVINRQDYNAALQEIDNENQVKKDEAAIARKEAQKEADLIDLENKRELQAGNLEYDLETQLQYLEQQKAQEIAAAEAKGADLQLINENYAAAEIQVKEAVRQAKLEIASGFFSNVSSILGEESKLGKAIAIGAVIAEKAKSVSQIVANTGVANTKAIAASPLTFGQPWVTVNSISAGASIAASVASGAKAIGEIKKAEKGALFEIGGKRHSQGGTKFFGEDGTRFEAEQGELIGVMNRNAAALFMDFNNSNASGSLSSNYFSDGGIVQRSIQGGTPFTQSPVSINPIDYSLLTDSLTQSIKQLPRPVTDVQDIIGSVNNYNQVVNGANI